MVAPELDFYVRDYNNGGGDLDTGVVPHGHPDVYSTSDVWNRNKNPDTPIVASDAVPLNDNPGIGAGNGGDNYIYCRIRRRAQGPDKQVTATFYVAGFGAGNNYFNTNTGPGPAQITFPNGAQRSIGYLQTDGTKPVTLPTPSPGPGQPPPMPPVLWHIGSVGAAHGCVAVEISTEDDPVTGSLAGANPASIAADNNKAQRNQEAHPVASDGPAASARFAMIGNPDMVERAIGLQYRVETVGVRGTPAGAIEIVGGDAVRLEAQGQFDLGRLSPGEKRWVGLRIPFVQGEPGGQVTVRFERLVEGKPADGFALVAEVSVVDAVIQEQFVESMQIVQRLQAFGVDVPKGLAGRLRGFVVEPRSGLEGTAFLSVGSDLLEVAVGATRTLGVRTGAFGIAAGAEAAKGQLQIGGAEGVSATAEVLSRLDAGLTDLLQSHGDAADTRQMVRWHLRLLRADSRLVDSAAGGRAVSLLDAFVTEFPAAESPNAGYGALLTTVVEPLSAHESVAPPFPAPPTARRHRWVGEVAAWQQLHREYLLEYSRRLATNKPR